MPNLGECQVPGSAVDPLPDEVRLAAVARVRFNYQSLDAGDQARNKGT
jgi:hypothetical protein